ncbi:hypothetical protein HETIRDRAFT_453178 [Heterobasidion irregulare TC 32-1]|uniref:Uncharacterized protein n=1 Tax=Heterobasidion irregulare (strain TC 32-1) TaxID=747525 RepID=W4JYA2_HETIT|nr:uncharacterized protein HETIRDRAFT_453178 [Heterobasidion irregulare TC 32-1]ETW78523.1 hypothetical protein HETIRDRAFT_453178 [Heterobasidion irregulare TC 32-1]
MLCVGVAGTASDAANALLIKHPHSSSPFCSRFSVLDPPAPLACLCRPRRWLCGAARRAAAAAAAAVFFARGASAFRWVAEVGACVFPKEGRCSVLELGDSESQDFFTQTATPAGHRSPTLTWDWVSASRPFPPPPWPVAPTAPPHSPSHPDRQTARPSPVRFTVPCLCRMQTHGSQPTPRRAFPATPHPPSATLPRRRLESRLPLPLLNTANPDSCHALIRAPPYVPTPIQRLLGTRALPVTRSSLPPGAPGLLPRTATQHSPSHLLLPPSRDPRRPSRSLYAPVLHARTHARSLSVPLPSPAFCPRSTPHPPVQSQPTLRAYLHSFPRPTLLRARPLPSALILPSQHTRSVATTSVTSFFCPRPSLASNAFPRAPARANSTQPASSLAPSGCYPAAPTTSAPRSDHLASARIRSDPSPIFLLRGHTAGPAPPTHMHRTRTEHNRAG